jgi:hypothetical protein
MKYLHRSAKSHLAYRGSFVAALALLSASSCTQAENDEPVGSESAALTLGPVNVLTRNYDNGRTGANTRETILTTSNVNAANFGLRFQVAVDDPVYAGVLYASQVPLAGGNKNVLYAATMNNSVYAFDADVGGSPLWKKNFNGSGRPTHSNEVGSNCGTYTDVGGGAVADIGIVGTPVIDAASGLMYVVTRTIEGASTFQRLHALDIITGADAAGSPVTIGAAGYNAVLNNQRPALALGNGRVYIGFSSFCDTGAYHGLILGYATANLAGAPQVYNVTPSGTQAGIWMGGAAPAIDASGNVYAVTGNGTSDTASNNLAEAMVKLSGSTLGLADFFMASNFAQLNNVDDDLGSGGPTLLPGVANRIVTGSKEGKVYLIKTDNLGHVSSGDSATAQVFQAVDKTQRIGVTYHVHNATVAWQSPAGLNLYVWGENDLLRAYRFNTGSGTFNTPAFAAGNRLPPQGMPGGMITLSSNGSTAGSGILWATTPLSGDANHSVVPGILRAFNAETLALLWEGTAEADNTRTFGKFNPPIVANGRVYVPSFSNLISAYGLAQASSPFVTANIPGTIEAENFDNGAEGVTYHDVDVANQGNAYRSSGVDIQPATEGAYNVGWTSTGEWLRYTVNIASSGTYNLTARVASQPGGGSFRVEMDGTDVTGSIAVGATGGWATWATVSKNGVNLSAGQHAMRVFVIAAGFNLNNLTFTSASYAGTPFGGTRASIPGTVQAENYDVGGENVAYHDNEAANLGNPGNTFRTNEGVDLENTADTGGGSNVGWTATGEWLMYSVNVTTTRAYTVTFRVASGLATGTTPTPKIRLEVDGGAVTGDMSVTPNGNWQGWTDVNVSNVNLTQGNHLLRVFVANAGWNLNYVRIQ